MLDLIKHETAEVLELSTSDVCENLSFVELGGNSLSAIALVNGCRRDWGLILDFKSVLTTPSLTDLSKSARWEKRLCRPKKDSSENAPKKSLFMVEQRSKYSGSSLEASKNVVVEAVDTHHSATRVLGLAPVPHMHLTFINGGQRQPGTNIIHYYETYDVRHLSTVKKAWMEVIESEPIFRVNFTLYEENGTLTEQKVAPFCWTEVTVSTTVMFENEVKKLHKTSKINSSFRVVILQTKPQQESKFTIIWRVHHALMDGHSYKVVLKKVRSAINGLPLRDGLSFVSLAKRLDEYRKTHQAKGKSFWKQQYDQHGAGYGLLSLPKNTNESNGVTTLPTDITIQVCGDDLSRFSKRVGVTLASTYYAAWGMVLSKFVGSDTVTCGAIFSCRNLPLEGITETLGSMVNTLPLTLVFDRSQSSVDYVRYVFQCLIKLSSFQWTVPEDGYTRNFSSVLGIQLEDSETPLVLNGHEVRTLQRPFSRVVTDIPLNICADGNGRVTFSFCEAHYSKRNVETMVEMFELALVTLLQPQQTMGMCLQGLLSLEHRKYLLAMGNCFSALTTGSVVSDDLVTIFERCAHSFPNIVALKKGPKTVTYAELNGLASSVAEYLVSIVAPGDVVCVHADRSINWIVAIYGVLKARAIYCPLDSGLSSDLRTSYLKDAGSHIFLTGIKNEQKLFLGHAAKIIAIEDILLNVLDAPSRNRPKLIYKHGQELRENAYLCFTSGSSGKPKGVMCTHKGLIAFQSDLEVRLFAQPGKRIAQIMSPAFDGSIHEIFSTLSYGATLVLESGTNPLDHLKSVTTAILTPSLAAMLHPSDYPSLETVYLVGEAVSQKLNDCWAATKQLYNMYGPTEATCGATIKRLQTNEPVTIGIPNPTTRIYILDDLQNLLPAGVIGEIYLAGVQVSRGYIGRSRETAKSFMPDTICNDKAGLMYRTGDRAFWNSKGEIVCLGRTDRQIKLRGFRLDLNDLETRILRAVPQATAVAITSKEDILVGMLQPKSLKPSDIRSLALKVLPPHAVPQHIVVVDDIPITPAGKTDYAAIAGFDFVASLPKVLLRDLSDLEKKISCAWRYVLNISEETMIYRDSNFFDLGGTSIQMLLLSHRLVAEFKRKVPLTSILQAKTLSELAKVMDAVQMTPEPYGELRKSLGEHGISPIEHEWWSRYQLSQDTSCFNVSFACSLADNIDRWKLTIAWNDVLFRHDILRCRYLEDKNGGVMRDYVSHPPRLQRIRTIDLDRQINLPFSLHQQHPIRVLMSKTSLLVVASHIICDLTTMRLLLREVASLYHGQGLGPVTTSYCHTDLWHTPPPKPTLEFWSRYLRNPPTLVSDIGNFKNRKSMYGGASQVFRVPAAIFGTMTKFTAFSRLTFHQLMLAAVSLALSYNLEEHDVLVGAPYLNRVSEDQMETVGLFLQPLPIRIQYADGNKNSKSTGFEQPAMNCSPPIDPFLLAVQASSHSALSHPIQWHHLLSHLNIAPDYPNHPLFDVMVTFHELESKPMFPIPGVRPLYTWTRGAKFKLMVEAQAISKDTLVIRLEYDEECFDDVTLRFFQSMLLVALDGFSRELAFATVKEKLKECARTGGKSNPQAEDIVSFAGLLEN
ncbi:hypothetical protein OCU04_000194 [Sclerotinia nivalis]|uniref:Carrier domain-containing protein n=1 Tax=Sclerotinia nivalis TaxID=352851 RepID=A0A9X0AZ02_9HELO|nr:hypothetical protein OCU04_000194 [Sclerotinia nivalis]